MYVEGRKIHPLALHPRQNVCNRKEHMWNWPWYPQNWKVNCSCRTALDEGSYLQETRPRVATVLCGSGTSPWAVNTDSTRSARNHSSLLPPWSYCIFVCCFLGPSFRTCSTSWLRKWKIFVLASRGGFQNCLYLCLGLFLKVWTLFFKRTLKTW